MEIKKITVQAEGYVYCRSKYYCANDILSKDTDYSFSPGVCKLKGEIDSGNWAVSYLLSMYGSSPKDFVLYDSPVTYVNDRPMPISELERYTCYLDERFHLFHGYSSAKKMVEKGLKQSGSDYSCDDFREMFCLDDERFERPLKTCGNEAIRAMAAIGFAYDRQVFCFPWLSNRRFVYHYNAIQTILDVLEQAGKIVLLPVGYNDGE